MGRQQLAQYKGQRVFLRGKIERFGENENGLLALVLINVTIETGDCAIPLDHAWLRNGIPDYVFRTYQPGEWISCYATIREYYNRRREMYSYGPAYPGSFVHSY